MTQTIKILSGLLLAQVLLLILVNIGGNKLAIYSSEEPILAVNTKDLSEIVLSDKEAKLHLSKQADGWQVKEASGFLADNKKVQDLLNTLTGLKKSWPVGKTEAAFQPLKVAQDDFERKIDLLAGDKLLGVLILGSSPSFKKVHARTEGSSLVYVVPMNVYDILVKPDQWLNKEYLYVDKKKVARIDLPQVSLELKDEQFIPTDLSDQEQLIETERDSLVTQAIDLRFAKLLGKELPEGYDKLEKTVSFSLKLKGSEQPLTYTAKGPYEKSYYVLNRVGDPFYFTISKGSIERLESATRKSLVKLKETAESSDGSASQKENLDDQSKAAEVVTGE